MQTSISASKFSLGLPAAATLTGAERLAVDQGTYPNAITAFTTVSAIAALAGGSFANPTALVGLTAVNGVATTAMRSDAAPALNQAITPTWTGNHTWAVGTEIFVNTIANTSGAMAITAGSGLTITSAAGITLAGPVGTGNNTITSTIPATTGPALFVNDGSTAVNGLVMNWSGLGYCAIGTTGASQTGALGYVTGLGAVISPALTWVANGNVAIPSGSLAVNYYVTAGSGAYGTYLRGAAGRGFLDGNYASTETSATSGCIYSIGGGSYQPGTTTLGTMYGVGYCYTNTTGGTLITGVTVGSNLWGLYVAAAGVARVFLDGTVGNGYFAGSLAVASNVTAATFNGTSFTGALIGNASTATSAAGCTGNSATATNATNVTSTLSAGVTGTTAAVNTSSTVVATTAFCNPQSSAAGTLSGYHKLPNGTIIQWGHFAGQAAGPATISFPLTFPNACQLVVGTPGINNSSFNTTTFTTTSFQFNFAASNSPLSWIAIGY
jgi:hypothetical protein